MTGTTREPACASGYMYETVHVAGLCTRAYRYTLCTILLFYLLSPR